MEEKKPSIQRILEASYFALMRCYTVATASQYSIFTHLSSGPKSVEEIAKLAEIQPRGAQALLDGLVGAGLVEVRDGRYVNSIDAEFFLVKGKPVYLGEYVKWAFLPFLTDVRQLPEVLKSGNPISQLADDDGAQYADLLPGLLPFAKANVDYTIARLEFSTRNAPQVLDVGGGHGVYAAFMLKANPTAIITQLDFGPVNALARHFVGSHGVADRFRTIDGDLTTAALGDEQYDVIVYADVTHVQSAEQNQDALTRIRKALKPGGTLVLTAFMTTDDRSGPNPFTLHVNTNMLVSTPAGAVWTQSDHRRWLAAAGFEEITLEVTERPQTFVFAR